ncbi:hypothetical protein NQ315_003563 [Exocentrus adspersus]|uniref:Uncharacterized protein n=1 Tax=Exocentrus adspersus TaxID=1586481 RepID=A0AAV8V6M7_9CUCU|nr:hypothetical protein NQ315_003563 [Exocentrus adspersus]
MPSPKTIHFYKYQNKSVVGFDVDTIEFKYLQVEDTINPETVNGFIAKPPKVKNIIVHGNVTFLSDLTVKGKINNFTINYNNTLLTNSDQTFKNFSANNMDTSTLTGKRVLDDFINIANGTHELNQNLKFLKDLSVNDLTVRRHLDDIPVKNGKLDILEKDSVGRQYVSGTKSFENLELSNPIQLRGKIKSKALDAMNPGFQGDLEITGDTSVFTINDIDMDKLEKNVLRQDGDQVISGKHYVKMVVAEKG